jgi:hypothetical protein
MRDSAPRHPQLASRRLLPLALNLLRMARRNNDSHGGETVNYYYLKVDHKYLSTGFSTQSAQPRRSDAFG